LDKLIVNYMEREKRFALIRNNQIERIFHDRPEQRSLVGNIYYGTVTKVLPGMNAAFVNIGEDKNAFIHRDAFPSLAKNQPITSVTHQGERLLVQVEKDATGTKGPRVTGLIELEGTSLIYIPKGRYLAVSKKIADEKEQSRLRRLGAKLKNDEEGLIFRTASIGAAEEEIGAEIMKLRADVEEMDRKANALKKPGLIFEKDNFNKILLTTIAKMTDGEVIVDDLALKKSLEEAMGTAEIKLMYYHEKENIFSSFKIEHEIDKALKRIVWLDNGSYLIFDETEALTIVDVNTGKFSGKGDYQDTILKTNRLAALEVVRQLKLRDIGGMVLIDFIDMKRDQDKQAITNAIETELAKDEKRTKLIGFTPLGILQLTRKRTKVALSEELQTKCPVCDGTGRILSAETVAFRLERELLEHRSSDHEAVLIETTNEVKEAFLGENNNYIEVLEETMRMKLFFTIKEFPSHYYLLKQFGTLGEIAHKAHELY
jgi:ribonuclease G